MDGMDWTLVRCLDNPDLQADDLTQPWHLGCVLRCLSGCHQAIAAGRDGLVCCITCRDGCVTDARAARAFPIQVLVVVVVALALVGLWVGRRGQWCTSRPGKQQGHRE